MCKLGLLQSDQIALLNSRIIKTSVCHSVGNLAKRFDGVNLTEAKPQRCNNYILLCVHWDSYRVTEVDT